MRSVPRLSISSAAFTPASVWWCFQLTLGDCAHRSVGGAAVPHTLGAPPPLPLHVPVARRFPAVTRSHAGAGAVLRLALAAVDASSSALSPLGLRALRDTNWRLQRLKKTKWSDAVCRAFLVRVGLAITPTFFIYFFFLGNKNIL